MVFEEVYSYSQLITTYLADSNTVLGRVLVGNSPEVGPDERVYFEDVLRAKTATAQWLPLSEMPPRPTAQTQ